MEKKKKTQELQTILHMHFVWSDFVFEFLRCEFLTVQKETYPCWAITGDTRPQQEYTRRRDTPSSGGNKVLLNNTVGG